MIAVIPGTFYFIIFQKTIQADGIGINMFLNALHEGVSLFIS